MNLTHDIKWWDKRVHRWEHNFVLSSEKLMHNETFWMILVMSLMLLGLIVFTFFIQNNAGHRISPPGPLNLFYPYV